MLHGAEQAAGAELEHARRRCVCSARCTRRYGSASFLADTQLETMRQIAEDEPIAPRRLQPKLPIELETICLKCLEKSPAMRYASAGPLAEDLRRFLAGEPIQARAYGPLTRTWKWAKRRPALSALSAVSVLFVLCLVTGSVLFSQYWHDQHENEHHLRKRVESQHRYAVDEWKRAESESAEAKKQRKEAEQAQAKAEEQTIFAKKLRDEADAEKVKTLHQLQLTRESLLTNQLMRVADVLRRDPQEGARLLQDPKFCPVEARDFAWNHYLLRCRPNFRTVRAHDGIARTSAISADGKFIVTGGYDGAIKGWDAITGKELFSFREHTGHVHAVAIDPTGTFVASGGNDHSIRIVNLNDRKPRVLVRDLPHSVARFVFARWSIRAAARSAGPNSGQPPLAPVHGRLTAKSRAAHCSCEPGHGASVLAECKFLATVGLDQSITIWDWQERSGCRLMKAVAYLPCIAISPDKLSAAGNLDQAGKSVARPRHGPRLFLSREKFNVKALAFSPNGRTLAVASSFIHLLDVPTRQKNKRTILPYRAPTASTGPATATS